MAVTCCTILINFNVIIFFEFNLIKFVWTASCYLLSVILHFCLCWTWLPAVHHCPSSACWATSDMCLYPSVPLWPSLSMHANLICICLSEPASVCVCMHAGMMDARVYAPACVYVWLHHVCVLSVSVRLSVFPFISFPIVYQGKRSEEHLLARSPGTGDIRSSEPARASHACWLQRQTYIALQ